MKYRVVLFQPSLRQFVFNFGKCLREGEFINKSAAPTRTLYDVLPTYDKEINRTKTHWKHWVRRIVGIPNIRMRYEKEGDLLFTYGTLLITNKPYCAYLETGLSFYNYDLGIGRNPIARFLVILLATRKNCHKIIFLSEAAKKSFSSSLYYPKKILQKLEKKSIVIYPVPLAESISTPPKKWQGKLRILFVGMHYIKGGVELANAFEKLHQKFSNVELTMVAAVHTIQDKEVERLKTIPGLTLLDAKLDSEKMRALYREHDVFCLPTYRDGFGLVLIEAIAHGMPLIITDQYATSEMVVSGESGFVFPNHPLQDYDPATYRLLGQYYNPKNFYARLFQLQKEGKLRSVEDFIASSLEKFLTQPELLERFSRKSLSLYAEKFHPEHIGKQLEAVFLDALKKE